MQGEEIKYLLDTSALYPLLRRLGKDAIPLLKHMAILDLTKYELGNVIWKEYKYSLIKKWDKLLDEWSEILSAITELTLYVDEIKEIENIAIKKNITFYDASYIYKAKKHGLKLVTRDQEILEKFKETIDLLKLLKNKK